MDQSVLNKIHPISLNKPELLEPGQIFYDSFLTTHFVLVEKYTNTAWRVYSIEAKRYDNYSAQHILEGWELKWID